MCLIIINEYKSEIYAYKSLFLLIKNYKVFFLSNIKLQIILFFIKDIKIYNSQNSYVDCQIILKKCDLIKEKYSNKGIDYMNKTNSDKLLFPDEF